MKGLLKEIRLSPEPDRIIVLVNSADGNHTPILSNRAVTIAREIVPKVTGSVAASLKPISGNGYFGIYFPDRRAWFLEQGTSPFTMRSLAGKVIPMWFEDPTGIMRRENPKAKTRVTVDGRTQVLIFRKVGVKGSTRKMIKRGPDGMRVAHYPGQAGRIAVREAANPLTTPGRQGGRIAKGNVGVAWRNPGMTGRQFMNFAMTVTSEENGLQPDAVYLTDSASFSALIRGQ